MVVRPGDFEDTKIENMRGGAGTVTISHICRKEEMTHCRLLARITIPAGASIGEHAHEEETEYYLIEAGSGEVIDNGAAEQVGPGDVVVTPHGSSHSIRNTGSGDLVMTAVIITY